MPASDAPARRDVRRAQVLAAARQLVAEGGLEALTIGALEARLEFTRGVITWHFKNKDEIVEAVLAGAIDEIDAATSVEVRASPDPRAGVRAVLASKVHGFLDHPEAVRVLLSFWGRLHADGRVQDVNAALYRRYRDEGTRFLAERLGAGDRAAVLAGLLVGTVIGIVLQATFDPGAIDVEAAIDEGARAIVAGLAAEPRRRTTRVRRGT